MARTAIDYVINVLNNDIESKYDYIYIVPVGITYLHREMFRSDVSVRINEAIKIDKNLLNNYNININNIDKDKTYSMAKQITNKLYKSIFDSTISSPDWHTICLSHLSRQVAFPESSNPREGIFCAQYVNLTQQFCQTFVDHKQDKDVQNCINALDKYWKLMYYHGLKDNRIFELQKNTSKLSIIARFVLFCLCKL